MVPGSHLIVYIPAPFHVFISRSFVPLGNSTAAAEVQAGVPSTTMLAVHTLPFPRLAAKPSAAGSLAHGTITRHAHVAQLNAAMRHLAGVHGYQVLPTLPEIPTPPPLQARCLIYF